MDILIAIALLGGLSLIFGLVLAAASKVFYVKTDPRLEQLNNCLPCANCGGCGYAGCSSYAEAILSEKHYDKDGNQTSGAMLKGNYEGIHDCLAASKVGGRGPLSCKFGCLGYGTCVKQCQYGAISIQNGVAVVDEDLCVGCMACAAVCPRGLITAVEPGPNVVIACNSMAKGAVTTRGCTVGCVGCSLCKKICPKDAITITKNLAVIDYTKCDNCGLCATVCPKKLIKDSNVENLPDPGLVHSRNNPDHE